MPESAVAVVGSETLIGREVRELITERRLPYEVQLISAGDQILTTDDEAPILIAELRRETLAHAEMVVLAGSAESSRKALLHAPAGAALVDVTGALEDNPDARINGAPPKGRVIRIVPHPAAIALARVLRAIQAQQAIRHAVVVIFEPASERGQAGINELQQQTTGLLSFRPLEKAVFDAQVSFAMLPRYGSDAPVALEAVEQRVERHLVSLLQGLVPVPSIRLVQSPVFHGHSFSIWVQFEERVDVQALVRGLHTAGLDIRGAGLEAPTNVGVAGDTDVTVGLIEADRNHPRAVWLWAVSDNLRIAADEAVRILGEILP